MGQLDGSLRWLHLTSHLTARASSIHDIFKWNDLQFQIQCSYPLQPLNSFLKPFHNHPKKFQFYSILHAVPRAQIVTLVIDMILVSKSNLGVVIIAFLIYKCGGFRGVLWVLQFPAFILTNILIFLNFFLLHSWSYRLRPKNVSRQLAVPAVPVRVSS